MSRKLRKLDREALKNGEYIYLEDENKEPEEPLVKREIVVVFVKEYKSFVAKYGRKQKNHYLLSTTKIIKEKFPNKFVVPNRTQAFLLNYEIKKLLDKAINIKNQKYDTIIYLNDECSITSIINTCRFLNKEYAHVEFNYECLNLEFDDTDKKKLSNDISSIRFDYAD